MNRVFFITKNRVFLIAQNRVFLITQKRVFFITQLEASPGRNAITMFLKSPMFSSSLLPHASLVSSRKTTPFTIVCVYHYWTFVSDDCKLVTLWNSPLLFPPAKLLDCAHNIHSYSTRSINPLWSRFIILNTDIKLPVALWLFNQLSNLKVILNYEKARAVISVWPNCSKGYPEVMWRPSCMLFIQLYPNV